MVNIQGYILCRQTKVTSRCRSYGSTCGTASRALRNVVQPYQRFRAVHCHRENKVCLGRHTWGALPVWGLGESLPLCSAMQRPSLSDPDPAVSRSGCQLSRRGRLASLVVPFDQPFPFYYGLLLLPIYEAKYTTLNPIQLPTTPSAEYALVNINGRNS